MKQKLWHNLETEQVLRELKTDRELGLGFEEVKLRQKKYGRNELPEAKPASNWLIFLRQLVSPLILILIAAGLITLFFEDYTDTIVIYGAALLNSLIGFVQERKTSRILQALKKVVKVKALVIRAGYELEITQEELVPGDIILLQAGSKIPADCRLLWVYEFKVNESTLTGEWLAAEKTTLALPADTSLAERANMSYLGTVAEEGRARAVVTATGLDTEIGKITALLAKTKEQPTPFQKRISHLSRLIGVVIVLAALAMFFFGVAVGRDSFEMFLTGVAVAVAAIPEGLPVAITVILTLGMQRILRQKGLVRHMVAVETLGSTSIIATDKTGTLTQAQMQVSGIFTGQDELLAHQNGYHRPINHQGQEAHVTALKIALLTTEAFIENPNDPLYEWQIRGRPTERALLLAGIQAGLNRQELEKTMPEIDHLPFDSLRKFSASLRATGQGQLLYVLGAPEILLAGSSYWDVDGRAEKLDDKKRQDFIKKFEELAGQGHRVVAGAYRPIQNTKSKIKNLGKLLEQLTFVGFIALHDPLRSEVKEAIKICQQSGVKPVIVTGDHQLTAQAIAKELGLPHQPENILSGKELDQLSDAELSRRVKKISIYARVEPAQKSRIIEAWQDKGQVVAMTGDGVNDAPALKKADIGVALGSGTDVAKEASDLVLLDDNFSVIVAAVKEGRVIVSNIRKTTTLLLSQSFAEFVLIGTSLLAGLPLPILPAQILWGNLIEGSPQGIALAFDPPEKDLMSHKPEPKNSQLLRPEMKTIIFGFGLVTAFILAGLFLWLLHLDTPLAEIRTIIFAALSIGTFFYAFSLRDIRRNIWQYNPFANKYLLAFVVFSLVMLLAAIYLPGLQTLLKTEPLGLFDWGLLALVGLLNLVLIEGLKLYFRNRQ